MGVLAPHCFGHYAFDKPPTTVARPVIDPCSQYLFVSKVCLAGCTIREVNIQGFAHRLQRMLIEGRVRPRMHENGTKVLARADGLASEVFNFYTHGQPHLIRYL